METFLNLNFLKSINFIVDRMDVKAGEEVLVYCEAEKIKIGQMLATESVRRGARVILAVGVAHTRHRQEPPATVAEAMKVSNVVFCVTEKSMTHTVARTVAINCGARIGLIIGIDEDYLSRFVMNQEDWTLIHERAKRLYQLQAEANNVRITSSSGTNLQMSIAGRTPIGSVFKMFEKITRAVILPDYFEASTALVEGSAEGTIVCDGWVMGVESILEEPVTVTVRKGEIVEIRGGWQAEELKKLLAGLDENAKQISELGIGLHHKAPKNWTGTIQDKKILGVTHIGFGKNDDIGGKIVSESHLDFIFKGGVIEFDGKVAIDKGVIMF